MGSTTMLVLADLQAFAARSPALLSAIIFLVVVGFIRSLMRRPVRLDLPIVGSNATKFGTQELLEGTTRYPDTPFILPLSPPLVILPISTLDEVRNLPEDRVSFSQDIRRMFMAKHTGIGNDRPEVIKAVKVDLTRHIASTLDGLQEEIRYAFDKELGPCKDWISYNLYSKMLRVVALLSGRVFVGRPLSREEAWINATIKYTVDCVGAREALSRWPLVLRGIVAPFLPEIRRVKGYKSDGGKLLDPILKAQLSKQKNEKIVDDKYDDEQGTFVSWLLKYTNENERSDSTNLAQSQMVLSFAAIHTTTMAACQAIFDLVCRPEYFQPLQEEIERVMEEDGTDTDGEGFLKLKKTSMPKLRKLDSFLKESQRLFPPGLVSNTRVTTAPLTLSTGHTLPTNTRIGYASYSIHVDPSTTTFSPSYNPPSTLPPSQFDGFRFYNLRAMEGKENKHQYVTTSPDSLVFGHGNHACPGRFFASNEIKVVMIELIQNWDIRLKGDVDRKGGEEKRPESHELELSLTPNVKAEIEFKRKT